MLHKIRTWIESRLQRRLMVSHLFVVLGGYLLLQLVLALFLALNIKHPTESLAQDAGIVARGLAHTMGRLAEDGQAEQLSWVLEMLLAENVDLSVPEFTRSQLEIQQEPLALPENWVERLQCVVYIDDAGVVIVQYGNCVSDGLPAQNELMVLAARGEMDPQLLSAPILNGDETLLLGTAVYNQSAAHGIVVVEMLPAEETALSPYEPFLQFVFMILISGLLLGLPALIIALGLSLLSGWITSRALVGRLRALEQTAQTMAAGNLMSQVKDTSPDEIGQVGSAFNELSQQLQETLSALTIEKERVESLLSARRDMVANISHDLRTPIATISAYLETLSSHPERFEEHAAILHDEISRLSHLIDDLFELARLDANVLPLSLAAVDLNNALSKIVASYQSLAWNNHRVVLNFVEAPSLPLVWADVQRIEQIMANLLVNALRYTPEGGIVVVETAVLPQVVSVCVSDTGSGIDAKDLPYIFDRFYRSDSARTRSTTQEQAGSGLGLAIVKGLVEAMGGSISATSELGDGTLIRFMLPIA